VTIAEDVAEAWRYHQAGDLGEAIRRYRRILRAAPFDADVWHLLGTAWQVSGNLAEATTCYQRALECRADSAEAHCNLGTIYKTQGRTADAVASYLEALRIKPSFAEAHNNLGLALTAQGKHGEAEASFHAAIQLLPAFAEAHYNLGNVLQLQGKLAESVACYRRSLSLKPNNPDALNNLGAALADLGELPQAETTLRWALAVQPRHAGAHNNLGNVLRDRGRLEEAIASYERSLQLEPNGANAYDNLGVILAVQWKLEDAVANFREALRFNPNFPEAWEHLGSALQLESKPAEAAACFQQALALRPDDCEVWAHLSTTLVQLNRREEATACLHEALRLRPHFPDAHCNFGVALEQIGDFPSAETSFREALHLDPSHARALSELALLLGGRLPEPDLATIQKLASDQALNALDRSALHFGAVRVHDSRGEYTAAARHAEQANSLDRAARRQLGQAYDSARYARRIDLTITTYTPEFFTRVRGWGLDTELPIFVLGLPRSGTTLIEQILASHPDVYGGGELNIGQRAFDALASASEFDVSAPTWIDRETVRRIAGTCVDQLRSLDSRATRVVDKMPDNYRYLGLLAALVPRARFIHCRRDLRDTALSCWLTRFLQINWASDIGTIASHFREYRRLMEHWRAVLPVSMLEVSYESLVSGLEEGARRLVAFCGLPWDPACLSFYETRRGVYTASLAQVRQPVYTHSVGRWKSYADTLAPLFNQLGELPP
jgi:tetratricopeptide (TPR) repeat protein